MKTIALAAMLALALCGPAQARVIEVAAPGEVVASTGSGAPPRPVVVLQSTTSDLAEPQVLAMMLVGLVLIGYKARRESSEKFK